MNESNEQWKLSGDCSKCRKQSYCATKCKAKKVRETERLNAIVGKAFIKATRVVFGNKR